MSLVVHFYDILPFSYLLLAWLHYTCVKRFNTYLFYFWVKTVPDDFWFCFFWNLKNLCWFEQRRKLLLINLNLSFKTFSFISRLELSLFIWNENGCSPTGFDINGLSNSVFYTELRLFRNQLFQFEYKKWTFFGIIATEQQATWIIIYEN